MQVRALLRPLAWVLVLAFLVPVAGLAEFCDDCVEGEEPGCCPPACSLCFYCCAQSLTVADGRLPNDRAPGRATTFGDPAAEGPLTPDPRDVFHVPKSFLI